MVPGSSAATTANRAPEYRPAKGTRYFVDSIKGNDAQSGKNPENAWKSLDRVSGATFEPGDEILFRSDATWEGTLGLSCSGTPDRPIIVGRYGRGSLPVISGAGERHAVYMKNPEHMVVRDLELTNPGEGTDVLRGGIFADWDEGGNFRNIRLSNLHIHDVRGVTSRGTRPSFYQNGAVYFSASNPETIVQDICVEDCHIHDIWGMGCRFRSSAERPTIRNPVFRHNRVERTGADALIMTHCVSPVVEHNRCYDAGGLGTEATAYIAGIWVGWYTHNSIFQCNEVARTRTFKGDGNAFDVDNECSGIHIFQYNYTHGNEGGPLMVMPSARADRILFRYNVCVNEYDQPHPQGHEAFWVPASGKSPVSIYNNTFYNDNGSRVTITDNPRVSVKNNIFCLKNGKHTYPERPTFDHNCFCGDIDAPDGNKVTGDPALLRPGTDADGMDTANAYRIGPDSACRDAGVEIDENGGRDFWGTPLYADKPDIGAHEFVAHPEE